MKQSIKSNMKLFTELLKVLLKSKAEYRFNFFMEIFINIFTYTVTYIQIWILTNNFNSICGWGFYELMLLYNFNLFSYGFACMIFYHPMRAIEELVRNGDFDGVLMKPMNPFVYMLLRQGYFGFCGHIILGIIVFIISFRHLQLTFSIGVLLDIIIKMLGAVLIQSSIMILTGALSFKFVRALSVMDVCIYKIRGFIDYPISIYSMGIQVFLTIIVPYAFVNYYPVEALIGKKDNFLPMWIADCGGIVIGVVLIISAYRFFMKYVDKYQSTGS